MIVQLNPGYGYGMVFTHIYSFSMIGKDTFLFKSIGDLYGDEVQKADYRSGDFHDKTVVLIKTINGDLLLERLGNPDLAVERLKYIGQ